MSLFVVNAFSGKFIHVVSFGDLSFAEKVRSLSDCHMDNYLFGAI